MNSDDKPSTIWARMHWVLLPLVVGTAACAKTDVQAPAKEAPSSVSPNEAEGHRDEEAPAAEAVAPAPPADDRWPQAGGAAAPKGQDALGRAPEGSQPAKAEKKKDEERERAAAKPASAPRSVGASEGAADSAEPALSLNESVTQLQVEFGNFEEALQLSVPNCSAAERFRHNVCTLAEHICTLEQGLPSTTPRRCEDGRRRCSEATNRYRDKCDS